MNMTLNDKGLKYGVFREVALNSKVKRITKDTQLGAGIKARMVRRY